jgi:hypothetical protein
VDVALALLCSKLALGGGSAIESPQSFASDSVTLAPQPDDLEFAGPPAEPSLALELNPMPIEFAKFGGNLELPLGTHHALIMSPAYYAFDPYFHGPVFEAGYRYFFSKRALRGLFLGVGGMAGFFQYEPDQYEGACGASAHPCPNEAATHVYGATLEVGWQWIARDWLLLGVGGGLAVQYAAPRKYDLHGSDLTSLAELVLDSGIRPRALGTVGVVF